jgi:putative hydrolase of the HAD superfamily
LSPRAVVFDFYGTLTAQRTTSDQVVARSEQAAALGVDVTRYDTELTTTVRERFAGAGGDLPGSLAWVAARCGVTVPTAVLERAAAVRLATERRFGEPRPEAVPLLTALRSRGLRIGLISDCSAELPLYFDELAIAPLVDVPVFSFVTGHTKPAPENYLTCCEGLAVEPSDCLYVGDGGSNELAGARAVGMRAVHLAVPDEVDGLVYGKHDSWDGDTVTSLTAVLDLL